MAPELILGLLHHANNWVTLTLTDEAGQGDGLQGKKWNVFYLQRLLHAKGATGIRHRWTGALPVGTGLPLSPTVQIREGVCACVCLCKSRSLKDFLIVVIKLDSSLPPPTDASPSTFKLSVPHHQGINAVIHTVLATWIPQDDHHSTCM